MIFDKKHRSPESSGGSGGVSSPDVLTILIIDDDKWIHKILDKYLSVFGFRIKSAYDPYEGLAMTLKLKPDLIFLDIVMPDVRGEFLLKMFRAIDEIASIPVIIMSGNLDKEVLGSTYRSGAADFIAKPLQKKVLASKLRQALGPAFDPYIKNADEETLKEYSIEKADCIIIV